MKVYTKIIQSLKEPSRDVFWLKPEEDRKKNTLYYYGPDGWTRICEVSTEDLQAVEDSSVANITYDKDTVQIIATNTSGTTLCTIDASDFVKDGMLNKVTYTKTDSSALLNFTFNTDAGKSDISINLSDLIDVYTAGTGITISNHVVYANIDETTIVADSAGQLSVNYDNDTITLNDEGKLGVTNSLDDTEKGWIEDEVFETYFVVSIARSSSYVVFSGSSTTVTWTLTAKYNGTLVDLDSVPSGWTRTGTGTYTSTTTITSTTGSSVSSGTVTCTYNSRSKTASSVSCTNVKYSYILFSTSSSIATSDLSDLATDGTRMNSSASSNTIAGTYSLTVPSTDSYAYFVIANTSSVSSITQLGVNFVNSASSITRTNYGIYKVYRSSNLLGAGNTLSVVVA